MDGITQRVAHRRRSRNGSGANDHADDGRRAGIASGISTGDDSVSGYNLPPKYVLDVMRAPTPPRPFVSPTKDNLLLVVIEQYPSIARVSLPFLRLAGMRVEVGNHSKHDTPGGYGITQCATRYSLVHVPDSGETPIALPRTHAPATRSGRRTESDSRL